jgi:DNA-binding protein H-NS
MKDVRCWLESEAQTSVNERDSVMNESIPRDAMSRTGHETEELRTREQEVENLRDEEQQERLREVSLNTDHGERHAGHIAKSVSGECSCRVPGNR